MKELLREKIYEIEMKTSGESREEAYQNAFKNLRKNIHSYIEGYLVEMHVQSIKLVKESEHIEIKKLFGLFMPVEHTHLDIELILQINVMEILK